MGDEMFPPAIGLTIELFITVTLSSPFPEAENVKSNIDLGDVVFRLLLLGE